MSVSQIEISPQIKDELIAELKKYLDDELDIQLGGFDAQFLLEFFERQLGCYYYNQGLADALQTFEGKVAEFADSIYELEKQPGSK